MPLPYNVFYKNSTAGDFPAVLFDYTGDCHVAFGSSQ